MVASSDLIVLVLVGARWNLVLVEEVALVNCCRIALRKKALRNVGKGEEVQVVEVLSLFIFGENGVSISSSFFP